MVGSHHNMRNYIKRLQALGRLRTTDLNPQRWGEESHGNKLEIHLRKGFNQENALLTQQTPMTDISELLMPRSKNKNRICLRSTNKALVMKRGERERERERELTFPSDSNDGICSFELQAIRISYLLYLVHQSLKQKGCQES